MSNALSAELWHLLVEVDSMIIWRGAGIVVVIAVLGVGVATQLATNAAFGNPTYYKDTDGPSS